MVVADVLFGTGTRTMDYRNIPTALFTTPPVAVVGLTEEAARERGEVRVFKHRFRPLKHSLTRREERTLVKVVVDRATDRVLGVHLVGHDAPEMVQGFAVALQLGVTKAQLDATIGIHPTAAEEILTLRTEWTGHP
jgi:glutathione reductase (NADPH)